MITEDFELETRLRDYGQNLAKEVVADPPLHARIMTRVAAPPAPRRRGLALELAAAAAILVIAVGAFLVIRHVRDQALASAAPVVEATVPADRATDVPLVGELSVSFKTRPQTMPVLSLSPADGRLEAPRWIGNTLVAHYAGLHPSAAYTATVQVSYRSRFGDEGRFAMSWRFTAEGPAQITATTPQDGAHDAARNGQVVVQFVRRPRVDPVIVVQPADGRRGSSGWDGSSFHFDYSGLQPERSYRVVLDVDLGSTSGNLHREWTFMTEPGAPPAGVPLIWFSATVPPAPGGPVDVQVSRLMALDWSGTLRGTLYQAGVPRQSPDGSRLLFGDRYVDQAGTLVSPVAGGTKGGPSVADDNRHLCQLLNAAGGSSFSGDGEAAWLFTGAIGSSPRRVAQFGSVGGQSGPEVLACSAVAGRAIVEEQAVMGVNEVRSISLATGATLYDRVYSNQKTASVVASHDGRYTAEQTMHLDGQGNVFDATIIRSLPSGAAVASLDHWSVVAFSWDGSRVVVVPAVGFPGVGSAVREVRVIEWRTGRVLWRTTFASTIPYPPVLAREGGGDFAIRLGASDAPGPADSLWIVAADGTARQVRSGPVGSTF